MEQLDLFSWQPGRRKEKGKLNPCEWKITSLRETTTNGLPRCDCPQLAVDYWRMHVNTAAHFNPDVECLVALMLNTKQFIRGHHLVSIGSLNETIAQPREVFRAAVIGAAYGVVLMHNHPSCDPAPSSADQRMTREMAEAGKHPRVEGNRPHHRRKSWLLVVSGVRDFMGDHSIFMEGFSVEKWLPAVASG